MDTNFQPVISPSTRGHYRQHPLEFKRALVALSLQPGALVARIARAHGVNANQVLSWRRLHNEGRLGEHALPPGWLCTSTAAAAFLRSPNIITSCG